MRARLSLIAIALGAVALVAGLATGCGSSSSDTRSTSASSGGPNYQGSATTTPSSGSSGPATVSVSDNSMS